VAYFDSVGNLVCGNITGGSLACSGTGSFASVSCNNLTVSNAETDAGTLTVTGLLTANGGINATSATLSGSINAGTSITAGTNVTTPTLIATSPTSITALGDIKYNTSTSLTSQMATLNGYKTSGSISATTSFQTIYTVAQGTRGIITVVCNSAPGTVMALFEWETASNTFAMLTQLAFSAGSSPGFPFAATAPNTSSSGSQTVFLQMALVSSNAAIQMKSSTAGTANWYVTLL
jgi:hypothetical protein